MALDLVVLPYASKNALSFNPNLSSGIPNILYYNKNNNLFIIINYI